MFKKILLYCALSLAALSCTGEFEERNTNPNLISQISPATLLNPIIYGMASHNASRSADVTFNLMQVSLPYPSISGGLHRYDVGPNIGASSWNNSYRWLANIREMRMAAEAAGDTNYLAIAMTLNAWVYSNLTDQFGPVPMTEALQGEASQNYYPAYDTQEFIYETILADLEEANALYDEEVDMAYASDILYANDILKWKKFTNSLRMRLLLRISNRTETNAFQQLTTMINDPVTYPVFSSNADSAILRVTGVAPLVSPWSRPQDFRLGVKMSSFFIDHLNSFNDPRLPFIATEATDLDSNPIGYQGIPSAYDGDDSQFQFEASTFEILQITNPMNIFIMTYAEVEFIKAEMAQRGYTSGTQTHYENGVEAAIQHMGATVPAGYFNDADVAFDGSLSQIMLQKYFALYFTDYQQWFEYRRTGLPELPTTSSMMNNGVMPARLPYPQDQQVYNPANYQDAVEMIGADDINTHVWWDNN